MRVLTPTYQATLHAAVQSYINLFELNVFGIFFFSNSNKFLQPAFTFISIHSIKACILNCINKLK